ncbi:MAG: nicotinamide riboside transporter PnuC [Variovorax sp.]|nr:MAG: nicotinamide riboside transporter PnuC [Variovorax sp.]
MNLLGQPVTALEIAAFVTGLATVWLTKIRHIWNWPVSLLNVACFMVLFYGAKLYADALLQIAFAVLGIVGWWQWTRAANGDAAHDVPVTRTPLREAALSLALCAVAIAAGAWALRRWTDSPVPIADTTLLVLSLLATWWQVRRRLECWLMWITVDIISVPLYWQRSLPLTAVLYVIFLLICLAGYVEWRRAWQRQQATPQPILANA